ncbi:MAG TPA: hypothetical protein VNS60_00930 [Solirubrobacterales bacterium]|nr:hypothetical protein [Solirubrobacterales bacterium]
MQELLSLAVVLEGGVGVMKAATIGLNDQAGVSPKEIGLKSATADVERDVDLGRREPTLAAHAEEHALQFTASSPRLRMKIVEDRAKACNSTATTAAPKQSTQRR